MAHDKPITREDLREVEEDIKNEVDERFQAIEIDLNNKFNNFNRLQEDRYKLVDERYERIEKLLQPIAEMYSHTTTFGKWVVAGLTFLTLFFGFLATAGDGFKAFKVFLHKLFI